MGTLWKTLSARIRGASTELEELGEEEDEFTQTTSKLQGLIKGLTGFDILEEDGKTFKDIYDIIIGIVKEWKNLDDIERASLGEALAGKRNANALYAVLDNLDTLESAYKTAEDASGSAMREQENYSKSIQYSIDSTKASLQELANDFLSSDFLKWVIDVGNAFVQWTDALGKIGGFAPLLAGIGTGVLSGVKDIGLIQFYNEAKNQRFTNNSILDQLANDLQFSGAKPELLLKSYGDALDKADESTKNLITDTLTSSKTNKEMADSLRNSKQATGVLSVGFESAGKAVKAFGMALANAAISMVAIFVVSKIVELLYHLANAAKEAKEAMDASISEWENQKSKVEDLNKELETTQDRINELQSKGVLSFTEEAELEKLQRQNDLLTQQVELEERRLELNAKQAAKDSVDAYKKNYGENVLRKEISDDNIQTIYDEYKNSKVANHEQIAEAGGDLNTLLAALRLAREDLEKAEEDYLEDSSEKNDEKVKRYEEEINNLKILIESSALELEEYKDTFNSDFMSEIDKEKYQPYLDSIEKTLALIDRETNEETALNKELSNIQKFFDGTSSKNTIAEHLKEVTKNGGSASKALHDLGITIDGVEDSDLDKYFKELTSKVDETTEAIDRFDGSLQSVSKAFESENASKDWDSLTGFMDSAFGTSSKDKVDTLIKDGKIGTDDFKSLVELLSPRRVSSEEYLNGFKNEADAYISAYDEVKDYLVNYFNSDDPLGSVNNYLNALADTDKKLITLTDLGNGMRSVDFSEEFTSSAKAAEQLGMSLESTEILLRNLQDYGVEFGEDFIWSGGELSKFETALNTLKATLEDAKKENPNSDFVENLERQIAEQEIIYENAKENIAELTKDDNKVIHIQFEADIAQLELEAQNAIDKFNSVNSEEMDVADFDFSEAYDQITNVFAAIEKYKEAAEKEGIELPVLPNLEEFHQKLAAAKNQKEKMQIYFEYMDQDGNQGLPAIMANLQNALNTGKYTEIYVGANTSTAQSNVNKVISWIENLLCSFGVTANTTEAENIITKLLSALQNVVVTIGMGLDASKFVSLYNSIANKVNTATGKTIMPTIDKTTTGAVASKVNGWIKSLSGGSNGSKGKSNTTKTVGGVTIDTKTGKAVKGSSQGLSGSALTKEQQKARERNQQKNGEKDKNNGTVVGGGNPHSSSSGGSGGSGGGGGGGSDQDEKEFKESVDWIEIAISRVQRAVEKLKTAASRTWTSWTDRVNGLNGAIAKTKEEINLQMQAYAGYLQEANSSELNEVYKQKVQNGTIDVETITDEELKKQIDEYKELYEKVLSAEDAIEQLNDSLVELRKQQFDDVESWFGDITEYYEKQWSAIDNKWSSRQDRTRISNSDIRNYYGQRQGLLEINIADTTEEINQLQSLLDAMVADGTIAQGSQEWLQMTNRIQEAKNAVEEYNNEIASNKAKAFMEQFENIQNDYEYNIGVISHAADRINKLQSIAESEGYTASKSWYEQLSRVEQQNIQQLEAQYSALKQSMENALNSGAIEKYSENWRTMQNSINDVESAIDDARQSLAEYAHEMRQIEWDFFDLQEDYISQMSDEANFLIDLMTTEDKLFDKRGRSTNQGLSVMGLHAVNYNTYMAQAAHYLAEIQKINQQLANDPNDIELLNRRKELLGVQRDMISAAEDEKEAIKNLVKEGYDQFLSYLKELIDARKDALKAEKDIKDYEKTVTKQVETVSSLQKQLLALSGDDSEEARNKRQSLQADLKEAKDSLEDIEYDQWLSDQEMLMDNLYSDFEQLINERLDNLDQVIQGVIDATNTNAYTIGTTIQSSANEVGYTMTDGMRSLTDTMVAAGNSEGNATRGAIVNFHDGVNSNFTAVQYSIEGVRGNLQSLQSATDQISTKLSQSIADNASSTNAIITAINSVATAVTSSISTFTSHSSQSTTTSNSTASTAKVANSGSYNAFLEYLSSGNIGGVSTKTLWEMYTSGQPLSSDIINALERDKTHWIQTHGAFAKGGTIGSLIKQTGEDGFILARTGEEVLSLEKIRELTGALGLLDNIMDNSINPRNVAHTVFDTNNNINTSLEFHLPNVQNGNDFITFLQSDKAQKIIQESTLGQAIGRSKLRRYTV